MSGGSEKIAALRATLAQAGLETLVANPHIPLGFAPADRELKGGIQRGTLHEIFAATGHEASATGFAAGLARRVAGKKKKILWIRQDYSALEFGELSATGFLEFGLDPARILLLCTARADDAIKGASDALTCSALGAVVIEIPGEPKILDLVTNRRLTLAAAQSNVPAFLLRFGAKPQASAAETRWVIRARASPTEEENWGQPVFETQLVRNRHGRTGHWVMEWNCDEGLFGEPTRGNPAHRLAVVPASGDRQVAAAMESQRAILI